MKAFCLLFTSLVFVAQSSAQTNTSTAKSNPDANEVYSFAEHMPEFPGGDKAFLDIIIKNIILPPINNNEDIPGTVKIRFIIDTDGSITNITFIRPVFTALATELVRVLKLMPKFKPAMQNGKAVKVYFNLPISDLYMGYKK